MQDGNPHIGWVTVILNVIDLVGCTLIRLRNFNIVTGLNMRALSGHRVVVRSMLNRVNHKVLVTVIQVIVIGFVGALEKLEN